MAILTLRVDLAALIVIASTFVGNAQTEQASADEITAAAISSGEASPQSPMPIPKPELPPVPHCDSYSMQSLPHLNFEQRACYWRSQLMTGTAVTGAVFTAFVAQLRHSPEEWGQGAQGYGYRVGTRYTQGMVKSTATFVAGLVSREDPRSTPPPGYDCPMQSSRVSARIGRSLARVFVSYQLRGDDKCVVRPAPARAIGSFASGFVQRAWLPDSQNTVGTALKGSGTALGGYIGSSLFSEFQGDLWRMLGVLFTRGKSNK